MKMMSETRGAAWLLALVLSAPGLVHAARLGRLIGKVVDQEGKPIAGVSVTTTSPRIPDFHEVTTTDAKGIFKVDFERIGITYHYELEKAGYVTLRLDQNWNVEGTDRHEFKMARTEPIPVAEGSPASTSETAVAAYNEGVAALKGKDHATAGARFEAAVAADPSLRLAWMGLAQVHLDQKRYREAAEAVEKAIALGAGDEAVLRLRWEAYRNLGDAAKTAEAREALEKFGRLSEEAKRIHNEGVALSKSGDAAGAYAKFKDALAINPAFTPALIGLATSGLKSGHAAEAAAAAETLLKADPHDEEAIRIRYNASLQVGDQKMIADALMALAAVEPATAKASLFKLATAAYDADDTANAKKRLAKVLELDPSHARAHYLLGFLLMREGAKQESARHLERFLELAPNDPDAGTARDALRFLKQS
jgi:Tfp pilus assembly protein PilF